MKITPVSLVIPSRNNQKLNREDSENTANRQPPKGKGRKGKKGKKKDFKNELSGKTNPLDIFSASSIAMSANRKSSSEIMDHLDQWSGL